MPPAGWATSLLQPSALVVTVLRQQPYCNDYANCRYPSVYSGCNSTVCQAPGTITYTANATNTTGITYSLDAASLTGGNTINAGTGAVTYATGWTGTTIITASAAGCNGP